MLTTCAVLFSNGVESSLFHGLMNGADFQRANAGDMKKLPIGLILQILTKHAYCFIRLIDDVKSFLFGALSLYLQLLLLMT